MNLPKHLLKNIDLISAKLLAEKKTNLLWEKQLPKRENILCWPELLQKKLRFLLLPKPLPRRDKPILETLQSQPRTKPKPRNKANQKHCKPKRKLETLKPILATWQNQLKIMPTKKIPPKGKKPRIWKSACWKKYWPEPLAWNMSPLKKVLNFCANLKTNFAIQIWFWFCSLASATQRFALPACGRAWILFGSRKNSKRGKCPKMPQNPTRQVHALLGGGFGKRHSSYGMPHFSTPFLPIVIK